VSYTAAATLGVLSAAMVDLAMLRTKLLLRKVFWTSYVIIVGFQLLVNGILTGQHLVVYSPHAIVGTRVVYAPVEDLMFGFALVLFTLSCWVWWGRRLPDQPVAAAAPRAPRARNAAGNATRARRPIPTETRRSSTR
jgi:lycopene cyclase domain-containing protein